MIAGGGDEARRADTPADRRRSRWIGLALALAGIAAAALAWRALAGGRRGSAGVAGSVAGGQVLAPLEVARDPASGEETAPFSGFAISVETEPGGALVMVDGQARGEAPLLAGIPCEPGRPIVLRAEKAGLAATRSIACRRDTLVKITLRLAR